MFKFQKLKKHTILKDDEFYIVSKVQANCLKTQKVVYTLHSFESYTPTVLWQGSYRSRNLLFQFPDLKSHAILVNVMESHGKAICFQKIKRQKDKKFEKITDKSKTGFKFSRNKNKYIFHAL